MSNVERLVTAGVLSDKYLTLETRDRINKMKLSDEDITTLKSFKDQLGLDPLSLASPGTNPGIGVWQL